MANVFGTLLHSKDKQEGESRPPTITHDPRIRSGASQKPNYRRNIRFLSVCVFLCFDVFARKPVQELEKEGHKAISIQDESPQLYLDDDDVVMGEFF